MSAMDEIYRERNTVFAALARQHARDGARVWIGRDKDEPDWPVLYIEKPDGSAQISMHYSPSDSDLLNGFPEGMGAWDGSPKEESMRRLREEW